MFGQGFTHMESNQLADGKYEATIKTAEIKDGTYGQQLILTVDIDSHPNAMPNTIYINDVPTSGFGSLTLEQAVKLWNINMTKTFANFGIKEGDFDPYHWVGKKGIVTVQPQRKKPQYKELLPYP